jgi:hypothetical protein
MALIDVLESVGSMDAFASLVQGEAWKAYLASLSNRPDPAGQVERLRRAVADAKKRLSPEHSCPELQALKERVYSAAADPEAQRPLLSRISELRASLPMRQHERLFGQVESAMGQMFSPGLGSTGYSNRARRARDLFTEFAGQTHIEGATADRHGNAAGTAYDLGRDGAFEGHTVHVLHLYTGEGFDFSLPAAAFQRKGFRLERRTSPGSAVEFRRWLGDAQQFWLIATLKRVLSTDHVKAIREFWQRGGALYIWGDNEPYYADANVVLQAIFGTDLNMKGNLPGGKVVHEITPARRGFQSHLITTGLEHLFEGITVASLVEEATGRYGFTPLLYGSAGNLITVVRDPTPACGAVMVDGAFTRLFCQWDEAGSARYVCNAACYLAAMTLPEDEPAEEVAVLEEEQSLLSYDPQGAFQGVCELTGERPATWLVLAVEQLGDALRNTSDLVLNDPLGAGGLNCIFSNQLYEEQIGQWIVAQGSDPYTRRPLVECLPLVDLSNERNLREFTLLLCKCLMGGKYLPTAARLLFFSVVDQMLAPPLPDHHRKAWEYLYRQCLMNFTSTPEFSELGRKMPLLDAMAAYFSPATDEMVQLRRSFATVGLIGRTLLREGRATRPQVRSIARRSLVKALVADAVAAEKTSPGSVQPTLLGMLYENFHGIPTLNGGRIVTQWPSFARDVSAARQRLERSLEAPLLTSAEQAAVLHALLGLDLRQFTAESAVERLLADSPAFRSVWHGKEPGDVLALLNARFTAYLDPIDWTDPHLSQAPPFATTYGPSVYRCVCGYEFGDPADVLTDEALLNLAYARWEHFRTVYRARGEGWYPGEGTLHCNLHRAVQRVVKEQFSDATDFTESMVSAVAEYLKRDAKGFICDPLLEQFLRQVLESYLALRRAGQPHPEGVLTLRVKAEREQVLRHGVGLTAVGAGSRR